MSRAGTAPKKAAADKANVVHEEVPVTAAISHNKQASLEEIAAEADIIYNRVRTSGLKKDDAAGRGALLKEVQEDHPDFNTSFPLPLRWTVETGQYRRPAFERYLRYMRGREWKDREDFLRDQGHYLTLLYKEMHPRYDARLVNQYQQSIVDQLLKENKDFEKAKEEAEKELKARNEEADKVRRRALYALLQGQKKANDAAGGPPLGEPSAVKVGAEPSPLVASAASDPGTSSALTAPSTAEATSNLTST